MPCGPQETCRRRLLVVQRSDYVLDSNVHGAVELMTARDGTVRKKSQPFRCR